MSHRTGMYSMVKTQSAQLAVWWAGGVLPPMIYPMRICCGVGKISTSNGGTLVTVQQAIPFKEKHGYWGVVGPIYKYLWNFLEDPEQWCDEEQLRPFKLRRYEIDS